MKLCAYSCRKDELEYINKFTKKYECETVICDDAPDLKNADLATGCKSVSVLTTPIEEDLLKKFKEIGVEYISTRSIGYDHIDMNAAEKFGIHIGNVSYSTDSVSDYAVMLILMAVRKFKAITMHGIVQDYSLNNVQGRVLKNLTVGVMGTGRIGRTVIQRLSAFGCRILAYDLYKNDETAKYAEYTDLDGIYKNSDVITLHMPATNDNYHIINRNSISKMKDGVIIVNTARGSLVDTDGFIDAVESGKIGGAAFDVVENESELYYYDLRDKIIKNRWLKMLQSYSNVIVTPHTAFYTDQVVSDMVEHSILSCSLFERKQKNPWQIM